jgi:DNA-binding CsgD family transcriptional regulator
VGVRIIMVDIVAADRDALGALLAGARHRRGAALVLRAPAGGGRTRLIDALAASADGWRVARYTPTESSNRPTLGLTPLVQQLLLIVPESRGAVARYAERLVVDPPRVVDDESHADDLADLLAACARHAPLLLVVDDAHRLDEASAGVLVGAASRDLAPGVVLLLTVALDADPRFEDAGLPLRDVGRLGPDDGARLIEGWAGQRPSKAVVDTLLEHVDAAAGALREIVRGLVPAQLAGWLPLPTPLPMVSDAASFSLLADLPDITRAALVVPAVALMAEPGIIARALELLGRSLGDLEPAEAQGIVHLDAHGLRFRSSSVRSLLVAEVPAAQIRAAHAALAQALTERMPMARRELAHHLVAATPVADPRASDLLRECAASAASDGDLLGAAGALHEAAVLGYADDAFELLLRAAAFARVAGAGVWAADLARQALERATTPSQRARAADARMRASIANGAGPVTRTTLVAQAEAVVGEDPSVASRLHLTATVEAVLRAPLAEAALLARRMLEIAPERAPATHHAGQWLQGLGALTGQHGSTVLARRDDRRPRDTEPPGAAIEPEVLEDDVWARSWTAFVQLSIAPLDEPRRELRDLVEELETTGRSGLLPFPLALLALAEYRQGWWVAAVSHAERACALAREQGQPIAEAGARAVLALVAAARGEDAACASQLAAIRRRAQLSGSESLLGYAAAAQGLLELGAGRPELAVPSLEEARRLATRVGFAPAVYASDGDLLQAYIEVGHVDRAAEVLAFLDRHADASVWTTGVIARGRLDVEQPAIAPFDELLETSLRAFGELTMPFEQARSQLAAAERHRRDGDERSALRLASMAGTVFDSLGATPWARRCERLRSEVEITRGAQDVYRTLTEQERRIAQFVAEGATNRTIAAHLELSEKTIEYHLHNVFVKLDITSRGQLIRFVVGGDANR